MPNDQHQGLDENEDEDTDRQCIGVEDGYEAIHIAVEKANAGGGRRVPGKPLRRGGENKTAGQGPGRCSAVQPYRRTGAPV